MEFENNYGEKKLEELLNQNVFFPTSKWKSYVSSISLT